MPYVAPGEVDPASYLGGVDNEAQPFHYYTRIGAVAPIVTGPVGPAQGGFTQMQLNGAGQLVRVDLKVGADLVPGELDQTHSGAAAPSGVPLIVAIEQSGTFGGPFAQVATVQLAPGQSTSQTAIATGPVKANTFYRLNVLQTGNAADVLAVLLTYQYG